MKPEITPRFFRTFQDSWIERVLVRMDWGLVAAALILSFMGLFFVYSATSHGPQAFATLSRQSAALVVGIVAMIFFVALPYQVMRTYATGLYLTSLLILLATLVFGVRLRGSRSWFNFHWFYFQPVEITRLILAVAVAAYADIRQRDLRDGEGLLLPFLLTGVHLGLILMQPDLSSALVLGPMMLAILYVAGAPPSILVGVILTGTLALGIPLASTYFGLAPGASGAQGIFAWIRRSFLQPTAFIELWGGVCVLMILGWWFLRRWKVAVSGVFLLSALTVVVTGVGGSFAVKKALKDYHRKRLISFVDPTLDSLGSGYNILQSEIAIGSGRFFGKGYLSGSQSQLGFLPEQHTDFIFSLMGEELGFFGALLVLGLYFLVVWRAFEIAMAARDRFGRFLAVGLGTHFAFFGLLNMGMVMGLMPVAGVPLPFLSYGGSALVGSLVAVGILLSIHQRRYFL